MAVTEAPAPPAAPAVGWRGLCAIAALTAGALVATSGRYGHHRDELYFREAGEHLAWGYPDQPPFTPLVARVAGELFGDSLVGLRLASAVAAGLVVLLTGLLAREFGAAARAQALAAGCMAGSAVLLVVGHLLSTATFDLLAWTALCWLVVRALQPKALRSADDRSAIVCRAGIGGGPRWLLVGAVAGVALQNKAQPAFLLAALVAGLVAVGPRAPLRDPWIWIAGLLALLIWAPFLIWQGANGWPLLDISAAIAAGSSGTSEPKWLFLPFQLVLVSAMLVPVWVAGLWRLLRAAELRTYRLFAVAYLLLAVFFLVTGGKPYYLAGLYPVLLAAGAQPTLDWVRRGASRARTVLLGAALALTAVSSAVLMLPLVPADQLADTPIVAINYDAGETVGWPEFAATIAAAQRALPPDERGRAIVLTRNYGEAGAVEFYRDKLRLPPAFSGHNGFWHWGPPPRDGVPVLAVGLEPDRLTELFARVEPVARIDNGVGLDNDEQGRTVWLCRDQRMPWSQAWPQLRRLG